MYRFNRVLSLLATGVLLGSALVSAAQETTTIAPGDTVTGTLSDDASNFNYDLAVTDQPLLFTVTSDDFTPTLGLAYASSQNGSVSASYDGDVGNPLFIPPLAEGQDVQLQVTSNRFPAEGDFTLTAVAVETTPITVGEQVEGTINSAPVYFSFEAELGKLITITAQGGAFDTRLQLFAPGAILSTAADNDGGVGYDPEIYQAVLTGSGTGYIEVAPEFAGEGGSFALLLTVDEPPTLTADGAATIRLGGARGIGALAFAAAGTAAQVTIASAGGDTDGAEIAVYQDGELLARENRFDAEDGAALDVTPASNSPVYVIITADTTFDEADEGQFTVSLSG